MVLVIVNTIHSYCGWTNFEKLGFESVTKEDWAAKDSGLERNLILGR